MDSDEILDKLKDVLAGEGLQVSISYILETFEDLDYCAVFTSPEAFVETFSKDGMFSHEVLITAAKTMRRVIIVGHEDDVLISVEGDLATVYKGRGIFKYREIATFPSKDVGEGLVGALKLMLVLCGDA